MVRLPDGMRDKIAEAAKANNRSMNAEIVARLQDSFEERSVASPRLKANADTIALEIEAIAAEVVRQMRLVVPDQEIAEAVMKIR